MEIKNQNKKKTKKKQCHKKKILNSKIIEIVQKQINLKMKYNTW